MKMKMLYHGKIQAAAMENACRGKWSICKASSVKQYEYL